MVTPAVAALIDAALEEDLGRGDVTSDAIFSPTAQARGVIVAKQKLTLAGLEVARAVFERVDESIRFDPLATDGDELPPGSPVANLSGSARSLLGAERTALNFLQRLSGIATLSRAFARAVAGTKAIVVDTRKTAPGWRTLDKAAVRSGGCQNHRADLASGILIKDNHIAACGSVAEAVRRARATAPHTLRVEVEVSTAAALDEALAAGAEILLLDNVSPAEAADLVRRAAGRALIEVSGRVRLDTVRAYAEAGVDRISSGALTHSAPAADLSLEIEVAPATDLLDGAAIAARLATRWLGRAWQHFPTCRSTNDEAAAWSRAPSPSGPAPHGAVVTADAQTAGRGRFARVWHSPPGENLYLSLILRPPLPPRAAPPLTLVAAVALAESLASEGADPELKWPNDLLLSGKKVAGILCEMASSSTPPERIEHVILGLGVNLNTRAFPPELADRATSLSLHVGHPIDRALFAADLCLRLETWYEVFLANGPPPIVDRWKHFARLFGTSLTIDNGRTRVTGVAEDLDPEGALLLRTPDGHPHRILAGEIQ